MTPTTPPAGLAIVHSWTLPLPFTRPLSTNQVMGLHWAKSRRLTQPWRDAAYWLAIKHKIPKLGRFTVVLHYVPRKPGDAVRDLDNLTATTKPLVDGLVAAGVCVDDNANRYTPTTPVIHAASGEPGRLWLTVTDLGNGATP